ncbi:MAG: hypothetical protein ACRELB_25260 [Polyangiaceae bacterium]
MPVPMKLRRRAAARLAPFASLLFLSLGVACSSKALKSAGTACTSDSECAAGLSCLDLVGSVSDAGCTAAIKACSKNCTLDSDCTPLGASFRCVPGCNGASSCGATQ